MGLITSISVIHQLNRQKNKIKARIHRAEKFVLLNPLSWERLYMKGYLNTWNGANWEIKY